MEFRHGNPIYGACNRTENDQLKAKVVLAVLHGYLVDEGLKGLKDKRTLVQNSIQTLATHINAQPTGGFMVAFNQLCKEHEDIIAASTKVRSGRLGKALDYGKALAKIDKDKDIRNQLTAAFAQEHLITMLQDNPIKTGHNRIDVLLQYLVNSALEDHVPLTNEKRRQARALLTTSHDNRITKNTY